MNKEKNNKNTVVGQKKHPLLYATIGVLGGVAIVFASLFAWQMINKNDSANGSKWYLNDKYLKSLTEDDIGTIKTVEVNGIGHLVRLIGIDHDELAGKTTKKAHTTWEFANLISDEDGYSLATFWNDIKRSDSEHPCPCSDYFNSSIRYALIGKGKPASHGWYEMGESKKSTTYTKPVIKMLPSDLANKIKPVKKTVISFADGADPAKEENYVKVECDDKLFMLSYSEISNTTADGFPHRNTGAIYPFYSEDKTLHIKRHVASNVFIQGVTEATIIEDSKQGIATGTNNIDNIAGYNSTYTSTSESGIVIPRGSGYWLRDLCANAFNSEYFENASKAAPACVSSGGDMCCSAYGHGDGNELAAPIAPAFCL